MTNPPPHPGIPTECVGCSAPLRAHNITRLCAECKLVARNRRLAGQPADTANPVTYDDAIANITRILGGRILDRYER
jgi:hypothetical protein